MAFQSEETGSDGGKDLDLSLYALQCQIGKLESIIPLDPLIKMQILMITFGGDVFPI